MCIIIVKKPGTILPKAQLVEATYTNGDGIGYYARLPDGQSEWGKCLHDRGEKWNRVCELAANKNALLVFHARIATHGKLSDELCHPFPVPSAAMLLFHNGMISGVHDKCSDNSDTSCFAEIIHEFVTEGYTPREVVRSFERELGWSKLVGVNVQTGRLSWWNRASFVERARGKLLYSNESAFVTFKWNPPKWNKKSETISGFVPKFVPKYEKAWDDIKWDSETKWDDYGYPRSWNLDD